jgi:hypothetical protein
MNFKGLVSPHDGHCSGPGHQSPRGIGDGGQGRAPLPRGWGFIRRLGDGGEWRFIRGLAAGNRRSIRRPGDGGERGSILLETVVASMVFAMVGVAVLSSLEMVYAYGARVEVQATAENLVRNQLEDAFGHEYLPPQTPYPTSVGVPPGYTVSITATDMPTPSPNIERLTVSVSHDGATVMSVGTIRFHKP